MKRFAAAAFAGLISLAVSAQIPSPPAPPAGMKEDIKVKTDSAVETGKGAADAKAGGEKAKGHAKKAKAGAKAKADAASSKAHKKVDDLAK